MSTSPTPLSLSLSLRLSYRCISYAISIVTQAGENKAKKAGSHISGGASLSTRDYKKRLQQTPFLFDGDMEEGIRFNVEDYAPQVRSSGSGSGQWAVGSGQ